MRLSDLPTPQVLVDHARLRANIDRMQAAASARGLRLRPHAKTHKSPVIARWQLERGAAGICCAKPGEAEVFAAAGLPDIRLAYPVNPSSAERVLDLMERTHLSIVVDDAGVARAWSEVVARAGRALDVLIKVDVGFHRCGIDPDAPGALSLIQQVDALPGLNLRGLLSHAGHGYQATSEDELEQIARTEAAILRRLGEAASASGVDLAELSVGATPTARYSVREPGLTEVRPGNYVYYDRTQVALGAATVDDCALTVMAMVVSRPAADRVILDCGSKTLSSDVARGIERATGYGAVFTDLDAVSPDPDVTIERLSEEHAVVRVSGASALRPGDRVRVLPNHACVVSNLVDRVQIVEKQQVLETIEVAARGKVY